MLVDDFVQEIQEEDADHLQLQMLVDQFVNDAVHEDTEEDIRRACIALSRIKKRMLRDTSNPFMDLLGTSFRKLYRFTPQRALDLVELLRHRLPAQYQDNAVSVEHQVLIALRFFAEGGFQRSVGQDMNHPVCQSTVSVILSRVVDALVSLREDFIRLPLTRQERLQTRAEFQKGIRIPGILGIVDGFLVRFKRPREFEEAYYNYREGPSVNVQIIVNSRGMITDLRIIPGSNNDIYNWQRSNARRFSEHLRGSAEIIADEGYYYIIGDGGYQPSSIMLVPFNDVDEGTPESAYNDEICRVRSLVERVIGMTSGVRKACSRARKLYYGPEKTAQIINACAILHNLRKIQGIPDEQGPFIADEEENIVHEINDNYRAGVTERDFIVQNFYTEENT